VQGEKNAIAPGKTPLSSMTPTIVTQGGKPVLVLGTPGGSRIPTVVLLTLLNVIDYGMNVQEAVDAPRFHQQWLPNPTSVEPFASARHAPHPRRHGPRVRASPLINHVTGDHDRRADARRPAGRRQPPLRRQRSAAQHRPRGGH
jgi:gamma-glutamyltranspeptidase